MTSPQPSGQRSENKRQAALARWARHRARAEGGGEVRRWAIISPKGMIVNSPILSNERETIQAFLDGWIIGSRGWGDWEELGWRCAMVRITK